MRVLKPAVLGAQAAFACRKCLLGCQQREAIRLFPKRALFPAAAYNAQDYLNLPVSKEVQDLFQLIGRSAGAAIVGMPPVLASLLLIGRSAGTAA